jgi:hypothetical protein
VQDAEHVEADHGPAKPAQRLDDHAVGGQTARVTAVRVVVFRGAIQTKPDGEFFSRQEVDPV